MLTHGHPTALAAADLTAYAVSELADGASPGDLLSGLRAYAASQRTVYHADWLGPLWNRTDLERPEAVIARGWDECLAALGRVETGLRLPRPIQDPCLIAGAGWTAEKALGTALLCFLLSPDDGVTTIRRAAATSGDSDSIACIAGALAGAHLGVAAWPDAWIQRLEYRERLASAGVFFEGLR